MSNAASPPRPSPPNLPQLVNIDDQLAPHSPAELKDFDIDEQTLLDCALKLASTVPHFTTEWAGDQLRIPLQLADEIFWRLKDDQLLEVLGQLGAFQYRYAITDRGRDFAGRIMEISGYIGAAPVTLPAYRAMIEWQTDHLPPVTLPRVQQALSHLVLTDHVIEVAALAAASRRSLFLFGPAGNGKTSIGRSLHSLAGDGEFWIPYAVSIDGHMVRIYDPQHHERVDLPPERARQVDQRWVRIRRPFVVAGGEMRLEEVELTWSPSLRYYEAPLQIKANGGIFFIDDLGRQHVKPVDLLNRWIVPLESRIDYLTLQTGQKFEIPFREMLIVATNLSVADVADPAFLRRMGYRLHVGAPNAVDYERIFRNYADAQGLSVSAKVMEFVLERYRREGRELRSSEPRDLIERVKDICQLRESPLEMTPEVIDMAWMSYFGNQAGVP